jgi:poly(A) polymerase
MRFKDAHRMKVSTLKRFLRMADFGEHLALHRLDCMAGKGALENYELVKRKLEDLPEEQLKPAPLVTGTDLIAEGYEPGPRFAEMLAAVEDAQLEGRVGSREEALAMVREMFPQDA